ncbi:MAG: hypothetical protein EZS28_049488 [Streblomastix strix]|uniref:Uncharacterized protein n=1 Tax=Streblomastix strix TaxID=222440 RepID=A0A5J4TC01_9EUKA|nr:MAG: hypothetical protein EZS28_049488 [Streblomastix strix]
MIVTALERGNGQEVRKEIEQSIEQRCAEIATIYRVHFDDFIDQALQVFELSEETEMLRNEIGPVARELRDYGQYLLKEVQLLFIYFNQRQTGSFACIAECRCHITDSQPTSCTSG